jgi:hypothetical protein
MPLFRRRPLLRAAAIGGGAYAAGKHFGRQDEAASQAAADNPGVGGTGGSGQGGLTDQDIERLKELGKLHDQGVLTDDELATQKARILGNG